MAVGGARGGRTCSRDEQKGQTYEAEGAAEQAGVGLGTGGHVQPPARRTPLAGVRRKALTSQWSCEARRAGAGPHVELHCPGCWGPRSPRWAAPGWTGLVGRPGVPWPSEAGWQGAALALGEDHGKRYHLYSGPWGQGGGSLESQRATAGKPQPPFVRMRASAAWWRGRGVAWGAAD